MSSPLLRNHLPLLAGLIFLAALSRLLPHPPNFGPAGALALFGAAVLPKRWMAVLVPFAALYLSDLLLNNLVYGQYYEGFYAGVNWSVYLGFALTIGLGFWWLRGRAFSWAAIGGTTVATTLLFYFVTNLASWYGMPALYPRSVAGVGAALVAGLPFLANSLAGNVLFGAVLFGTARYLGWRSAPEVPRYVREND